MPARLLKRTLLLPAWLALGPVAMTHALTWGTFGSWDTQQRRDAADAAMLRVTDRHNAYGDFNFGNDGFVDVYYNPGVPTAQANFYGSIEFGGTYPNERVAQHELNHWVGSGTIQAWYDRFSGGVWTGPKVNALMAQFDGDGAAFRQSGVHFFPYGLNFDTEVVEASVYMRNVALMYAMRQDMGIGNPADPWSATSVTLSASDPAGTSSFNWAPDPHPIFGSTYQGWDDGYFAHVGAAYTTGDFVIRTPLRTDNPGGATPNFTFAGDSLRINNTNGSAGGLLYQGVGSGGVVTVNNLILDGGYVRHGSGSADVFKLAGSTTLLGNPTIDADQGDIRIDATIGGPGTLNVTGNHRVILGGTANTYSGGTVVQSGTLVVDGGTGTGTTTVQNGATLTGDGAVRGALVAQAGSIIRVGGAGLPATLPGGRQLIDDFEGYPTGVIGATPNTTGNVWTGVFNGTGNAEIVDNAGDAALQVHGIGSGGNNWRGAITDLAGAHADDFSLAHGQTGTYFFRVRRNGTGNIDTIFGLTDQGAGTGSAPGNDIDSPWDEYAVLLSIFGGAGSSQLRAYSDGSGDVPLISAGNGDWINIWLEVDNAAKSYRVATSTGTQDGTYQGGTYQFGRRTAGVVATNALVTFGIHELLNTDAELDDLYFVDGVDLTNPLLQTPTLAAESLGVLGDVTLQAGATLSMDIGVNADGAAVSDTIATLGQFNAGGVLEIVLDTGSAALDAGDRFGLFGASGFSGTFDTLDLPGLGPDLLWDASRLLVDGTLAVIGNNGLSGDFNFSGQVEQGDLDLVLQNWGYDAGAFGVPTAWINDLPTGLIDQEELDRVLLNWGAIATGGGGFITVVPEPTGLGLFVLSAGVALRRRRR